MTLVPTDERISTFWLNGAKPLARDADPVGVEGHVGEAKLAGGVSGRGLVEFADGVGEMNGDIGNHGAGRIGHGAAHSAGVAALGLTR